MKPRALVTGSAGFIGRHLCPALDAAGYDVDEVDLKNGRSPHFYDEALEVFRDEDFMPRFDLVVHLAANVGGRTNIDGAPFELLADNLELDVALFQWARRRQPRRIVYFSSSAVYPVERQTSSADGALREADLDARALHHGTPDATYGFSKLVGERLALEARDAGIPVTVVRPFSGYGTDQDLDYPFPAFIDRARRREDPFTIWGGHQARDFVHVDDVIGAVLAFVAAEVDGPVNICSGQATTFAELGELVTTAAGYDPTFAFDADKPVGTLWRVGNPDLMLEHYKPTVTLEDGIARALA